MALEIYKVNVGGGQVGEDSFLRRYERPEISGDSFDGSLVIELVRERCPYASWGVSELSGLLPAGSSEIIVRLTQVKGAPAETSRLEFGALGPDGCLAPTTRVDLPTDCRILPDAYLAIPLVRADGARVVLVNRN